MKILKIAVLLFCTTLVSFAQPVKKQNAAFTIRGNVGIPRTVSSSMFRNAFNGIYEANLSLNLRLFDNFFAGVGYQNSFFQNNKFLKFKYFNNSVPYETRLLSHAGFIKLGYDKFFSETGYASYSLNTGIMLNSFTDVNLDTNKKNQPFVSQEFITPYIQPEVSLNFVVDPHLSFSLMLSYATMFYRFDPKAPRLAQFDEVSSKKNNYFMSYINIGFGFTVLIDKKVKQ
jgi:hypothetical protein